MDTRRSKAENCSSRLLVLAITCT